jgi:hypothetical protein
VHDAGGAGLDGDVGVVDEPPLPTIGVGDERPQLGGRQVGVDLTADDDRLGHGPKAIATCQLHIVDPAGTVLCNR